LSPFATTAQLVWYVTGRFYKTSSGDLLDVGYFLHLQGVGGALFDGKPRSEATALFTFAAAPFQASMVDNDNLSVGIDARGSFSIYRRDAGGATFDDPSTFSAGQCIATFERVSIVATAETTSLFSNVFTAQLVSANDFDFAGGRYNFRDIVGDGITQWGVAAPGTSAAVPFVGSAIRIG
jgi:hypothetical protein